MATLPEATAVPPVDALVSEVVASLALAAHAYLEPGGGLAPDVASAEIAIDVAAVGFERIAARLGPEERSAIASLLTDVRMACVPETKLVNDVLVLNFTYEALNITSFQRAVKLLFSGKAEVVHGRSQMLSSPSYEMRLPSIIRMLYYIRRPMQKVALTKKNILLRDDYTCQYCNLKGERLMTVDHVLPRSKGGPSTWENLVCACMRCNNRKNNRTPEHANMPLRRKPKAPKYIPWIRVKRNTLPGEWHKFLFLYNVSIDERVE